MVGLLVALGVVSEMVVRRLVSRGRLDTWLGMGALYCVLVPAALASGQVVWRAGVGLGAAVAIGTVSAIVLFAATRLFLSVAGRWARFARDTSDLYASRGRYPIGVVLPIGVGVGCGEEVFWRGLVFACFTSFLERGPAAALSWGAYVGVSAVAGSLPVVAGAIVGGLVWLALVLWSGGVLAGVVCHGLWTLLMIALPPTGTSGLTALRGSGSTSATEA